MSAKDYSAFGPPMPAGTHPDANPTYFVQIPGQEHWIPAAGPTDGLLIMAEEVERLRGILGETERAIAGLVQIVGMDYDPDLHPADTLQLFERALCDRLDNPV
jgi:hypothetical protein